MVGDSECVLCVAARCVRPRAARASAWAQPALDFLPRPALDRVGVDMEMPPRAALGGAARGCPRLVALACSLPCRRLPCPPALDSSALVLALDILPPRCLPALDLLSRPACPPRQPCRRLPALDF